MATFEKRGPMQIRVKIRKNGFPPLAQTFATRAEAEAFARVTELAMEQGTWLDTRQSDKTSFSTLARMYREQYAKDHYRGAAWEYKLDQLEKRLGAYALSKITPSVIASYRDARLQDADARFKDKKNAPCVSSSTVKTELDLLSKIFDVADRAFGITLPQGNPMQRVLRPKENKGREKRLPPGTAEEKSLLKAAAEDVNKLLAPAIRLSIETGIRQGELLSLLWNDVYTGRRLILLRNTKSGEPRSVPLSSTAVEILEGLRERSTHDSGRVFGDISHPTTLQHAFRRACSVAGITGLTWHDLRHEALSRLGERGDLSVLEIAAISGHKSLQTLKRYTHFEAERLARKLG